MKTRLVRVYEVSTDGSADVHQFDSAKEARAYFNATKKTTKRTVTIDKLTYEVPFNKGLDVDRDECVDSEEVASSK